MSQSFAQGTINPFESLGQKHNDGCLYAMQNLSYIPEESNRKSVIVQTLRNVFPPSDFVGYTATPDFPTFEQHMAYATASYSPSFKSQISTILDFLKTDPSVSEINSFIATKESSVNSSVPSVEIDSYFAFLAVVKYSARLWLPLEKGGQNASQYFTVPRTNNGDNGGGVLAITWWKVIVIDGFSIIGGGLLGGPGGAIVGGVVGSTCEVVSQW